MHDVAVNGNVRGGGPDENVQLVKSASGSAFIAPAKLSDSAKGDTKPTWRMTRASPAWSCGPE